MVKATLLSGWHTICSCLLGPMRKKVEPIDKRLPTVYGTAVAKAEESAKNTGAKERPGQR